MLLNPSYYLAMKNTRAFFKAKTPSNTGSNLLSSTGQQRLLAKTPIALEYCT
jgi:hypothetical protein